LKRLQAALPIGSTLSQNPSQTPVASPQKAPGKSNKINKNFPPKVDIRQRSDLMKRQSSIVA
jgi:hypothetical protein